MSLKHGDGFSILMLFCTSRNSSIVFGTSRWNNEVCPGTSVSPISILAMPLLIKLSNPIFSINFTHKKYDIYDSRYSRIRFT